jgi:hypothetical protein
MDHRREEYGTYYITNGCRWCLMGLVLLHLLFFVCSVFSGLVDRFYLGIEWFVVL